MSEISFVVAGAPVPQGSKTKTRWGGIREDNPRTKPWRDAVASDAMAALNGGDLLLGPVFVDVSLVIARPQSHFGTGRNAGVLKPSAPYWCTTRPDADKVARAIGDALAGVLYRNDGQVAVWAIRKYYGEPTRAEITVRTVE